MCPTRLRNSSIRYILFTLLAFNLSDASRIQPSAIQEEIAAHNTTVTIVPDLSTVQTNHSTPSKIQPNTTYNGSRLGNSDLSAEFDFPLSEVLERQRNKRRTKHGRKSRHRVRNRHKESRDHRGNELVSSKEIRKGAKKSSGELYTDWSRWTRCNKRCVQKRRKKCRKKHICDNAIIREERSCVGWRCRKKNKKEEPTMTEANGILGSGSRTTLHRQKSEKPGDPQLAKVPATHKDKTEGRHKLDGQEKKFKVVRGRKSSQRDVRLLLNYNSMFYSRWSDWSDCSAKCITSRYRWCKYNLFCGGAIVREEAYCYSPGGRCEEQYKLHKEDFPPVIDFFADTLPGSHQRHDLNRLFGIDRHSSFFNRQDRFGSRRGSLFESAPSPFSSHEFLGPSRHEDLFASFARENGFRPPSGSRMDFAGPVSGRGSGLKPSKEGRHEYHHFGDWSTSVEGDGYPSGGQSGEGVILEPVLQEPNSNGGSPSGGPFSGSGRNQVSSSTFAGDSNYQISAASQASSTSRETPPSLFSTSFSGPKYSLSSFPSTLSSSLSKFGKTSLLDANKTAVQNQSSSAMSYASSGVIQNHQQTRLPLTHPNIDSPNQHQQIFTSDRDIYSLNTTPELDKNHSAMVLPPKISLHNDIIFDLHPLDPPSLLNSLSPPNTDPSPPSSPSLNAVCGISRKDMWQSTAHPHRKRHRGRLSLRILGGHEAQRGQWPWQVVILNRYKEAFCGGVIIGPQWVLTAAHCVRKRLYVRLGEHDLTIREGSEIEFRINATYPHPLYDSTTVDNDVALLQLPFPVDYTPYIAPVCLPAQGTSLPVGARCTIIGWGKERNSHLFGTDVLHQAEVPIINSASCRSEYWDYHITPNMFCAGYRGGRVDSCAGDSGGPLLCRMDNTWHIYGITSFGEGCGRQGKYGIYAKVSNYRSWITAVMAAHQDDGSAHAPGKTSHTGRNSHKRRGRRF